MEELTDRNDQKRCPVCGKGVFTDVVYEEPQPGSYEPRQSADSYEVLVFSCGHRVTGARLDEADPERMTVEERQSEDTAEPVERDDVQPGEEGEER